MRFVLVTGVQTFALPISLPVDCPGTRCFLASPSMARPAYDRSSFRPASLMPSIHDVAALARVLIKTASGDRERVLQAQRVSVRVDHGGRLMFKKKHDRSLH